MDLKTKNALDHWVRGQELSRLILDSAEQGGFTIRECLTACGMVQASIAEAGSLDEKILHEQLDYIIQARRALKKANESSSVGA